MKLILFQFLAILIVTSAAMVDTDLVGEDEPSNTFVIYNFSHPQHSSKSGGIAPSSCKSGKNPCYGAGAKASIGPLSCNNGVYQNCAYTASKGIGVIGQGSCNGGFGACWSNGKLGTGIIGNSSCRSTGKDMSQRTCSHNGFWEGTTGKIGSNACNANFACNANKGVIANGCCNYKGACNSNKATIFYGTRDCLGSVKGNVQVAYYVADSWWKLQDFSKLTPYKYDMFRDINFDKKEGEFATSGRDDHLAALFDGKIKFSNVGTYTLCLTSDDGGKLYMDGNVTIDLDGLHPPEEKCTPYVVEAVGSVPFKIEYFEKVEVAALILKWIVPGTTDKVLVPAVAYV